MLAGASSLPLLPDPPTDPSSLTLPVSRHSGDLFRVHDSRYGPVFFGKTGSNRFDDPLGSYAVLYAATGLEGAAAEVLGWFRSTSGMTSAVSAGWLRTRSWSRLCVGLFERVQPEVAVAETADFFADPARLAALLRRYGLALLP